MPGPILSEAEANAYEASRTDRDRRKGGRERQARYADALRTRDQLITEAARRYKQSALLRADPTLAEVTAHLRRRHPELCLNKVTGRKLSDTRLRVILSDAQQKRSTD